MKIIFCLTAAVIMFAVAAEARYVRKLKEPEFFIPEQYKMHQPEKLPEIKVKESEKKVKKEQVFSEVPEYKTKYSKYVAAMNVLAKTKTLPDDSDTDNDLQAMQSGEIFEVVIEAPQDITTKEQKEFLDIAAKIMQN